MLRTQILKSVFFTAILLTGLLLLYVYLVVHPGYHDLLVENTEDESVRYVSFLVHAYKLDQGPVHSAMVPSEVAQDIERFDQDSELIKLRAFDATGKIVYSTVPREIGSINQHDYFHEKVAHGEVYSKIVRKDSFTAELEIVKTDLVETYVPIMGQGAFYGAIETYYDITKSSEAIRGLTTHSMISLGVVSFVLLSLLYYSLRHADRSIIARMRAEDDLRRSNEELESRVAERAGELIRVNQNLNDEISERTLAQRALSEALADMEEAKEKIDGILRSVNDGILVVDQDEKVILMNGPAEQIIGLNLARVSGEKIHEFEMPASLKSALNDLLNSPDHAHADFELPQPAPERPRIFQARTSALRDTDGSIFGTVILMQNVTIEREVERMKSDFLAMAAHELMTPLASIMGYSELLGSEASGQFTETQTREFSNYIHVKAENLSRIVDDLLDLSRIESGQEMSIAKIDFDLCVIMQRLVKVYNETNQSHRFVLNNHCGNCKLFADPIRIEQVIENLLSNAAKYSPTGGEIRAECRGDNQRCHIEIVDQGIGMTDEHVAHIFDKFYRVDISDTAKQGVGLGLSISKHIIDAHQGTIEVTSKLGQGTRVVFSLPKKGIEVTTEAGEGHEPAAV